ncbi:DUF4231 domain-containing protein [Streptantibioticus parmotrematis]|uniref:DUF4231 domain-containing protein n=1 Tax=Streptantibioticus parmotrematis TaxID=2873249 RepID=UPI0033E3AD96
MTDTATASAPGDDEPATPTGRITARRYLDTRLAAYQEWYDRKAIRTKAMYLRMRTVSVVGAALVPVLLNIGMPYAREIATALSLVVTGSVSLESVYRYREQWKNYRSTEQLLGHERIYYEARVGPYTALDDTAAFRLLVARVEKAIANENSATLNVMTLGGQVGNDLAAGDPSPPEAVAAPAAAEA